MFHACVEAKGSVKQPYTRFWLPQRNIQIVSNPPRMRRLCPEIALAPQGWAHHLPQHTKKRRRLAPAAAAGAALQLREQILVVFFEMGEGWEENGGVEWRGDKARAPPCI